MVTYNERVENMSDNDIYDTYLFNNHIGKVKHFPFLTTDMLFNTIFFSIFSGDCLEQRS